MTGSDGNSAAQHYTHILRTLAGPQYPPSEAELTEAAKLKLAYDAEGYPSAVNSVTCER